MNKILALILVVFLTIPVGCAQNRTSALEKLRVRFGKDPIESMRFPKKKSSSQNQGYRTKKQVSENSTALNGLGAIEENLKPIKKMSNNRSFKRVRITAKQTTLRKGPGTQFKSAGISRKGDEFRLLKIMKGPNDNNNWFLSLDDKENRVFISSLFAEIDENSIDKKTTHTKLKTKRNSTLKQLEQVIDPSPKLPKELIKAKHLTLNFEDTEVYDVITTFCELLKLDYIIEGEVSGKVTLQTFNKIPVNDLYSVLEQILALHNIAVVKSGNFYRFLSIKDAVKKPLSIYYGSNANVPVNERLIIQIIPLKHISGESMKKIIAPLLTSNASFIEIPETNNLMLVELSANISRILKVVEALDIDKLAFSDIEMYTMKHADVSILATELDEVFVALGFSDALGDTLNFLPLERLNSLLVVNPFKSVLPTIEFWINKLDQPISESQVATFVYYVQNASASSLQGILQTLFEAKNEKAANAKSSLSKKLLKKQLKTAKGKTPSQKAPGATGKQKKASRTKVSVEGAISSEPEEFTVISDQDTNSLIIRTNPRTYPAVLEIIKKLDLMPQQVLIEVLIMDVVLDDQTQAGLEWALEGKVENAKFASGSGVGTGVASTLASSDALILDPGFFFSLANVNKFKALVNALAADSKANILSNPTLITSDNKPANISITDEVPIQSTTITTPTAGQPLTQSTIQFRSVGIKLNIEPKINSDNFVNLKINQEISSTGAIAPGSNTPSFNVRSVSTEVVLKDNQVLVMGGLMQTDKTEASTGIPGLKDLPFLGKLFGATTQTKRKTELMIFVTPHVISTVEDAEVVTNQLKSRLSELKKTHRLKIR